MPTLSSVHRFDDPFFVYSLLYLPSMEISTFGVLDRNSLFTETANQQKIQITITPHTISSLEKEETNKQVTAAMSKFSSQTDVGGTVHDKGGELQRWLRGKGPEFTGWVPRVVGPSLQHGKQKWENSWGSLASSVRELQVWWERLPQERS